MKSNKISALGVLCLSLIIPVVSFAQSSDTTATQQLNSNSYTFSSPSSISFTPVFAEANQIEVAQKVLDPSVSSEIVEFVDLRNSGTFTVNAYINSFTDDETEESISYTSFALATRSTSGTYTVDMHANNSISAGTETVNGPLDYSESLVGGGEIPSDNYSSFPAGSGSTSGSLTIIDGSTLPLGKSGRVGSFSVAPALKASIPSNIYGTFNGTLTFELSL